MFRVLILLYLFSFISGALYAKNLLVNADFSDGLNHWELYGRDLEQIKLGEGLGPNGSNIVILPVAHASIAEVVAVKPQRVYELSFAYKPSSSATRGGLVVFLNKTGGINASAGSINLSFPKSPDEQIPGEWNEFREAFRTPSGATFIKVVLSARGSGEMSYANIYLRELPSMEYDKPLLPSSDWSRLRRIRTQTPLFDELLKDEHGNITVVCWIHHMIKSRLPAHLIDKYTDEEWEEKLVEMFEESGKVNMHHYSLPWQGDKADEMHELFGMMFETNCESSAVMANAIRAGAEVINPNASETTSAARATSLIDPIYLQTAVDEIKRHATRFLGKPYVFAYIGRDEPEIYVPEGAVSEWGPFWRQCAEEVLHEYGFGKFGIPAPQDPEFIADTEKRPFRWIAYNRWMADKYAESKKEIYEALKSVDSDARYNPCDYWFMTGFHPFDFAQMARYSDFVECDPYASSAERIKGRGLYNHGFGAKFLKDITGKPTRAIVQAFNYAGYEMTPEDLLEWVSQSLRAGADHISYYQMDNPRFTDPDRWEMMLYISEFITNMNAIELPDDPEAAILYSSDSYRSHGYSTAANEIYAAYSLLGERIGSWFEFVDDDSLARGEKDLSKYRAVYIPLANFQRLSVIKQVESFVKAGGVVISGDPAVFSWDIDGSDMSSWRERIFGVRTIEPAHRDTIVWKDENWGEGLEPGFMLPIFRPVRRDGWWEDNGWKVEVAKPGVRALARFIDGTPAITKANYGKGAAIYFAANPFIPELLFENDRWERVFLALQKYLGAEVDRPIWRFRLPMPE